MKVAVVDKFGKKSQIVIKNIAKPRCHCNNILLKVHACSLNPIDYKIKLGKFRLFTAFKKYKTVASDFCGEVVEVGSQVKDYHLGDFVYGMVNPLKTGTCSEYVLVKPNEIYHKPPNIDVYETAALPIASLTAYQALVYLGKIKSRKAPKVLINGSSGGVGHFAVQIAKYLGAEVTAICSFRSRHFVHSLGADTIIDYTKESLFVYGTKYDIIFDVQGNLLYKNIKKYLTNDGCYINTQPDNMSVIKNAFGVVSSVFTKKKAKFILASSKPKDLKEISNMIASGHLRVTIEKKYSLEDVSNAFAQLERGRVQGKLIINIL